MTHCSENRMKCYSLVLLVVGFGGAISGCTEQKPAVTPVLAAKPTPEVAATTQPQARTSERANAAAEAQKQAGLAAGVDAVVYGLPLVLMDVTKEKATNVPKPQGLLGAPLNQFGHVREFPTASFKDVVRANVDTLYSSAFLDLTAEPIVLTLPDTAGRYYLMPMLDAYTNVFASPGKRTTGTKAGNYAITGPGWHGTLPKGVSEIKAPTNLVWIIGRTQTNGPKDYAAVHAIQDGYRLVPLSAFGKPYEPPAGGVNPAFDMNTPPVEQVEKMSAEVFFARVAALLKSNPPPATDAPMLAKLKAIGIVPGEKFEPSRLEPHYAEGLKESLAVAIQKLREGMNEAGTPLNGWRVPPSNVGNFGTDYGTRAVVALNGLGANRPEDATYPSAFVDVDGKPLNGAHDYVIHFDKGALPPVKAFWSITMYNKVSFFVDNPLNRYAISSFMPLKKNADGSLDIYVQRESPGKAKESNWLPADAGEFNVTLRMYWPNDEGPSIVTGSWNPPPITRAKRPPS